MGINHNQLASRVNPRRFFYPVLRRLSLGGITHGAPGFFILEDGRR